MRKIPHLMTARRHIFGVLVVLLCAILAASVIPTQAQTTSPVPSCAITPSLLGGQGFTVSGQGFTVSGQGFTVSGQGFTVSGQSYTLDDIVNQIKNNRITVGKWVDDRLDFFTQRLGFNTNSTAIIIADEFNTPDAHGYEVKQVVDEAIAAIKARQQLTDPSFTPKLDVFTIDISDTNTNYDASKIASKIAAKVDDLKTSYHHFVLNMSFGLIACQDSGTSETPAFDFNQAMQVVEANNQADPSLEIMPVLDCVQKTRNDDDGHSGWHRGGSGGGDSYTYTAYFGYVSQNAQLASIPIGSRNTFGSSYYSQDKGQPIFFEPGAQHFVFAVEFTSGSVTWSLNGPDGVTHTVSANKYSTPCSAPVSDPTQYVVPVVDCVANNGDSSYTAEFGYTNPNQLGKRIDVGSYNKFTTGSQNRGQVTTFVPGEHHSVFKVTFTGSSLTWYLKGKTATATPSSPACATPEGYGVSDYLTQNLGVPQDQLADYWKHLSDVASQDNSLDGLHNLLKKYLQDSADPSKNFSLVPVASSGNLLPFVGPAPLAPASWPETIAVGATLGDTDNIWIFSQNANVVAPGAGYPFSDTNYGAGTSFSAPVFSVLAGMCSTVPNGLIFDGSNPPLVPPVLDGSGSKILTNSPIGLTDLSPLNCKPNRAPTIDPIGNQSNPTGTSVSLQVSASDPDGDTLSYSASNLPPGLNISSSTGLISGLVGGPATTYHVIVRVTDSRVPEGMANVQFDWEVTPPPVIHVDIDIKPYSPQNRINLRSWGTVLVAIFGSPTLDASTIDPHSLTLAGAPIVMRKWWLPDAVLFDINHDGKKDLLVRFWVRNLDLTPASTEAELDGSTYGGQAIQGSDAVKIVPPHAPHDLSPSTGTSVRGSTVTLGWEPVDEEDEAQTCYQVVIANNPNFNRPVQSATVIQLQNYTSFQLGNGTYYWHVAISDCAGNIISPWSDTWGFSMRGR